MREYRRDGASRVGLMVLAFAGCAAGLSAFASGEEPQKKKGPAAQEAPSRGKDAPKGARPVPTFTKHVAPILQAKCQNCHRRHQVGPFPLETYEQARKRAHDIVSVTEDRSMPPWKPTRGVGPKLKHDQSLSPAELAVLSAWADGGTPLGDPKDLPPPPTFAEGWKLGPPDLI